MSISVLVADDSPTIRRRAQATLGEAGFEVHCVEDGDKAWQELQGGRKVDVLLCDILMPRLDGYQLCGRVKGDGSLSSIPVLLLRGTFEPWDEAKAHEAGADGFITKPFEPENLVGTVRDVLESAAEEAASPAASSAPSAPAEPEPAEPAETEPAAPAVAEDDPFGGGEEPAPQAGSGGDDDPFALGDAEAASAAPAAEPSPPASAPATAPAAVPSGSSGGSVPSAASPLEVGSLDDAALDALAEKVAAKLAGDVIEKLAWDVVPEVAEALVRKRMIEIESKLQGG